ncbi:hypothetical protein XMM379_002865 [Aliiroseovarius sp. xm-m-379]|uniref:Uncharacterized protein n=1 Tax=Aliiroseovarius crassostreae TaxID=154981 RepID=A0A9Q9HGP9_9RHOB|nr:MULTISPECIES: hypothetical protein [Aliiroseovarius]NRP11856.1 hypothetical protein [Aliiroseovarius sp. xm-d-517]NRP26156.1 hypothetical protein [Aliiroseovarius sp. xm-m-379]NRP31639.1 hypothetical protein [Aliiroseovarius sp. xm-m-314]NRP34955.1 hypothetical protein [Aliiroseovarius sp. xm-a-104]NRP42182.1 hypothetical protein [Aliiroseovarius sp. xm-m-339-2]
MALRIIKLVLFLSIVSGIGVLGYAYLGDMSPDATPQSMSVILNDG